jgi:alanine racemase
MHLDTVRVGISLYGLAEPVAGMSLLPAMTLQARLVQRRWLAPGEGVGYGLAWRSGRDSLVGLVPVGYADGLKRGLSGRIEGYLRGARVPQIGTISMDQASFDLTDTGGDVGETMEILGPNSMSISDWARILGSIPYEVACDLRTRLPRVYVRS